MIRNEWALLFLVMIIDPIFGRWTVGLLAFLCHGFGSTSNTVILGLPVQTVREWMLPAAYCLEPKRPVTAAPSPLPPYRQTDAHTHTHKM